MNGENVSKIIMTRSHFPDVRIDKEAETLLDNGHEILLLAWDRRKTSEINETKYKVKTMKLPVYAGSIKVVFFLPIWWIYLIYQLSVLKFDIVHAADFDTYVPALIVSKIKRKKIIYDIFDYYAEMIVFPIFPKFLKFFISQVDIFLMKFANAVILADESRINQIGKDANRHIITINNSPIERSYYKKFNGLTNNKFKIFFGGVVQEDKGIVNMISVVKDLQDVELIIRGYCGSEDFENRLYTMCQNLSNIHLHLKRVPYDDILNNTMRADLLFTLYDTNIPNNVYASPNKLFESMMCEKPIIVNEGTTMENIVAKYQCGLIVSYNNTEEIKKAILKIKCDHSLRKKLGQNGRKAFESRYKWSIMEKKLIGLYNDLI